jgi:hypothetical protein
MQSVIENDPLNKWYPGHPRHKFMKARDYPPPEHRLQYVLPSKLSFESLDKYVTALGFGAIQEDHHNSTMTKRLGGEILPAKFVTIPSAGDRRYFGFLFLPESLEVRLQPHDVLRSISILVSTTKGVNAMRAYTCYPTWCCPIIHSDTPMGKGITNVF